MDDFDLAVIPEQHDDFEQSARGIEADAQLALRVLVIERATGEHRPSGRLRVVVADNKAWDAAEDVRREWLTALISRKTLPKNTNDVIAKCLTNATYEIADMLTRGGETTRTMLGIDGRGRAAVAQYLADHPTKAQHVTLATILGAVEDKTSRETWRNPSPAFAVYLTALSEWGYTLSDVENIAAMTEPTE